MEFVLPWEIVVRPNLTNQTICYGHEQSNILMMMELDYCCHHNHINHLRTVAACMCTGINILLCTTKSLWLHHPSPYKPDIISTLLTTASYICYNIGPNMTTRLWCRGRGEDSNYAKFKCTTYRACYSVKY